ncbi:DUF1016 N-terminal domain-containing protein [Pedobacter agri]|uniref:DUF1016 N-terminal domain-containing protein n=1 Tax=Pedobacter agri TaxID=454586 RepID=UPI00292E5E5F|nr:DUF1016 N-terminal domain-containing protein [Pedobacter agri]
MSAEKPFTLFEKVKNIVTDTHLAVVRNINAAMVNAYFQIGMMIIEDQQNGMHRANYAKETLVKLSLALNKEFGKGYSVSNLEYMRNFYLLCQYRISQTLSGISDNPFKLSWSHYTHLVRIKDFDERTFYEIESINNNWSVRELQRQFNSALFERIALSKDKEGISQLSKSGQLIEKPTDILKSHYILEFLRLEKKASILKVTINQPLLISWKTLCSN